MRLCTFLTCNIRSSIPTSVNILDLTSKTIHTMTKNRWKSPVPMKNFWPACNHKAPFFPRHMIPTAERLEIIPTHWNDVKTSLESTSNSVSINKIWCAEGSGRSKRFDNLNVIFWWSIRQARLLQIVQRVQPRRSRCTWYIGFQL